MITDNEVLQAQEALEKGTPLDIREMTSGCAALFTRGYFPWGSLPYPKEHAELGSLLLKLGKTDLAHKMARWQSQTLDHYKRPIFSLFNQERSCTYKELESAVLNFLGEASYTEPLGLFSDSELGLVRILNDEETFLSVASGCKSGMGAHLFRDVGVINYGPQLLPIGDCAGFGLAGKPRTFSLDGGKVHYQTRLAAPHARNTHLPIQDSGYSGLWIEVEQTMEETICQFDGFRPLNTCAFCFFLKAPAVFVAGSHKLNPKSLDRYMGPPSTIQLQGGMELEVLDGATQMEIIPLAGDESFWGADFLASFTLSSPFRFTTRALR
ncbi:MAG: hypothetical protein H7A36_07800 [Chlamydiales bacterium]|nr:hypothetical protein [Chlamydiales bacterium]